MSSDPGFNESLPSQIINKSVIFSQSKFNNNRGAVFKQLKHTNFCLLKFDDLDNSALSKLSNIFENDGVACMIFTETLQLLLTSSQTEIGQIALTNSLLKVDNVGPQYLICSVDISDSQSVQSVQTVSSPSVGTTSEVLTVSPTAEHSIRTTISTAYSKKSSEITSIGAIPSIVAVRVRVTSLQKICEKIANDQELFHVKCGDAVKFAGGQERLESLDEVKAPSYTRLAEQLLTGISKNPNLNRSASSNSFPRIAKRKPIEVRDFIEEVDINFGIKYSIVQMASPHYVYPFCARECKSENAKNHHLNFSGCPGSTTSLTNFVIPSNVRLNSNSTKLSQPLIPSWSTVRKTNKVETKTSSMSHSYATLQEFNVNSC